MRLIARCIRCSGVSTYVEDRDSVEVLGGDILQKVVERCSASGLVPCFSDCGQLHDDLGRSGGVFSKCYDSCYQSACLGLLSCCHPGQRCSVGSSLRYQPTPSTREQRSAQDYTFEALHRVYFYDAWRVQPVLDAPESDLVLPPKPGLLEHGCYWPRPNLTPEVLSISDRDPEKEDQEVQEGQSPTSLAVTDAAMAEEDANEAVSIHSSSSESPTIPSTEQPEDDDAHMADDASASTSSAEEEGDCLSNRPALPDGCPAQDEMLEAEDDAGSELPPQDVDPPSSSPTSQSSESPIKRRPGSKASAGQAQSKKLRKSLAPPSRQPLGSIPEHEQPPATLADLASRNAQNPVAPACRNPKTPPDHPGAAQERPQAMVCTQ